jgi:CO/xanthine dehydrogenase Mo-binding subunit
MDDGKILNPNLVDYKVMRATEMPETKVFEKEAAEVDEEY